MAFVPRSRFVSMPASQTLSLSTDSDRLSRRAWAALVVLCAALFLDALDVSMIGVALPSIRTDLDMSTSSLQWVVSAYVLGYGGFLLLGGRAADLLGRRRMFLISLAVFLVASGLGGLANDGGLLIATRFIKGVSAAFTAPAGLSIITTSFPEGAARNKALSVYTATGATGFSLGLVLGGLLTEIGWRWVFFLPVPVALVALLAAVRLVPADGGPSRLSRGFDLAGAVTMTGAMLLLVFTLVEAPTAGWGSTRTLGSFVAAAGILAVFVARELSTAAPLVRLGILRSAPLLRANAGAMLLVGSFMAFQFVAVLYLQELRGWSEVETGLALAVLGIDAVLAPTLTPILVNRLGNPRVVVAGLVLAAVAYLLLLPLGPDWSFWAMLPAFLVLGLAFALAYGPLTIAGTDGVADEEQGLASGLLTTSFQFGAALGLAVAAAADVAATGRTDRPRPCSTATALR
jgi:EmrB/QacA subfamily drug resistance transporter